MTACVIAFPEGVSEERGGSEAATTREEEGEEEKECETAGPGTEAGSEPSAARYDRATRGGTSPAPAERNSSDPDREASEDRHRNRTKDAKGKPMK